MADISIDLAAKADTQRGGRAFVFTTDAIGYFFFIDADDDFKYVKTTNGGSTWGSPVTIRAGTHLAFDVWFDQWTPGDSGTVIHTWMISSDDGDVRYRTLDTSGDALGTERQVFAGVSAAASAATHVSGTKARGGNLFCGFNIDNGIEFGSRRSTDGGATWTTRTNWVNSNVGCQHWLFPGNEADTQDVCLLTYNRNSSTATLKVHDDSADTNAESSAIISTLGDSTTDLVAQLRFGASIRHSDGHLIFAIFSELDTATSDLRVFDINGTGSIVEKTAIQTNIDDSHYPSVCIDQGNNHIYIAYVGKKDGSETLGTTASVCYVKSTDGGDTWGAEVVYSATASDWRRTWAPISGPRLMVAWRDISTNELLTNFDNAVTFTPAFAVNARGEGILSPPSLTTGIGLAVNVRGEGQLTAPALVSWEWSASARGEGSVTADLTTSEWRVNARGEGGLASLPNLILFPGWAVNVVGEGAVTADLTSFALQVNVLGEGSVTADLTVSPSVTARGELVGTANLTVSAALAVVARGEGSVRALLSDLVAPVSIGVFPPTLSISETLGGGNSASFTFHGEDQDVGSEVEIELDSTLFFSGVALKTRKHFVENKATGQTTVSAVGHDWHLTRRRITASYYNVSATEVILGIASRMPWFDTSNVQAGMPTIERISFKGEQLKQALTKTMNYVNGHWRVQYPNLLCAGLTEAFGSDPEPLTPSHPTLRNWEITWDISQVVNMLRVKGAGGKLVPAPPLTFPDFFDVEYSKLLGIDRTLVYPVGSTRLYVDAIEIQRPDLLDANGQPFNPPKTVPPLPIFNPAGGKVLVDERHALSYSSVGVQENPTWGFNSSEQFVVASNTGGSLPNDNRSYHYVATLVTQWGESTRKAEEQALQLSSRVVAGALVRDGSFLIRVKPIVNPNVRSVNVYRRSTEGSGWGPWIRVGSVPSGGGSITDSADIPSVDELDELPTEDTSEPPPMPYIQLSNPLTQPLRVGDSVRVFVELHDLESQAHMASRLSTPTRTDDGVIEDELDDPDLAYDQIEAVGRAHLAIRTQIEVTPSWSCRDRNTHPGKNQAIDMPDLQGIFKIQTVTLSEFDPAGFSGSGLTFSPLFQAVASSRRFSVSELLRMVKR